MKYRYFKFSNPKGSDNVFIARVQEGNITYEYRAMKRKNNMFFNWDSDWIEHKVHMDATTLMSKSEAFSEMEQDEVFEELL